MKIIMHTPRGIFRSATYTHKKDFQEALSELETAFCDDNYSLRFVEIGLEGGTNKSLIFTKQMFFETVFEIDRTQTA